MLLSSKCDSPEGMLTLSSTKQRCVKGRVTGECQPSPLASMLSKGAARCQQDTPDLWSFKIGQQAPGHWLPGLPCTFIPCEMPPPTRHLVPPSTECQMDAGSSCSFAFLWPEREAVGYEGISEICPFPAF